MYYKRTAGEQLSLKKVQAIKKIDKKILQTQSVPQDIKDMVVKLLRTFL